MKGVLGASFVISLGVCVAVGCAESPQDEFGLGIDTNEPAPDAGDEGGKNKKIVVTDDDDDKKPSTTDDDDTLGDDDDDNTSSSSSSGSTSSSSGSTSSSSSSSSSSGGGTSSGALDPCKVLACNSSKAQGTMSGDTTGSKTLTGAASQWFTVDVTENNNSFSGRSLRLTATLTSPPGKNFDLFMYLPQGGGQKTCSINEESSEKETGDDTVSLKWGEADDDLPNGSKDDRTVTIEVREIVDPAAPAGTCDPTAKWSLKIEGNK